MSALDWGVFVLFLAYVVWDGMRRAKGTTDLGDYYAGGRRIPWWAAGLSIMATQASAITVIGTTGEGHEFGMQFLHIYYGLPLAMVLLCVFFVPMLRRAPILTAYEYLEYRFGPSTRTIASAVFLVSRSLALGVVIYAPSVVLSAVTGLDETLTVLIIGLLTTCYTMVGGVSAVIWTDVKQMAIILGGLALAFGVLLSRVLADVSISEALTAIGAVGKLNAVQIVPEHAELWPGVTGTPSFWSEKYNIWTGLFGGTFLMLAYFGCDQSQVQRILTNRSANESRKALLVSAFAKIPMQFGVLLIGAMMWLFHALHGAPLLFDPNQDAKVRGEARIAIEAEYAEVAESRRADLLAYVRSPDDSAARVDALREYKASHAAFEAIRERARALAEPDSDKPKRDTNYVFPYFVLHELPTICIGLIVAAIFAAAMSSIDSVLNSLSAATVVDFYGRWVRRRATDRQSLRAGRIATLVWGLIATSMALWFGGGGSVIELVNKVGSFFYGTLLGGFAMAFLIPRARELAASVGMVVGMSSVLLVHFTLEVEFLWYNLIGCMAVLATGALITLIAGLRGSAPPRTGSLPG